MLITNWRNSAIRMAGLTFGKCFRIYLLRWARGGQTRKLGFIPKKSSHTSGLWESLNPSSLCVYEMSFLQGVLLTFIISLIIQLFPQRKASGGSMHPISSFIPRRESGGLQRKILSSSVIWISGLVHAFFALGTLWGWKIFLRKKKIIITYGKSLKVMHLWLKAIFINLKNERSCCCFGVPDIPFL